MKLNFLMIVGFDIVAIDSKGITLPVEALDHLTLGIIETFLWEIFRSTNICKFVIHQRLIDHFLFEIISKMVMHLGLPIEKVYEDFIAIHEATGGKRLVKACYG